MANSKIETFAQFLSTQSPDAPLLTFGVNLALAITTGYVIGRVYVRYGESLSNRRLFARNFLLLPAITMIVIAIVKSSLALSLGLVGALSIVRFRAAIKEPEELTYLFLCIAIGLGLGADQTAITLTGFALLVAVIVVRRKISAPAHTAPNLILTVASAGPTKVALPAIVNVLKEHCESVSVKRFDEAADSLEASFLVEFAGFDQLEKARRALLMLHESVRVHFLDTKGIASC